MTTITLKKNIQEVLKDIPPANRPSHVRIAERNKTETENEFLERVENTLGKIESVRFDRENNAAKVIYRYRDV